MIAEGEAADLTVIDPNRSYTVDPADFRSMGKAGPFNGWTVEGAIAMTLCGGETVYKREEKR